MLRIVRGWGLVPSLRSGDRDEGRLHEFRARGSGRRGRTRIRLCRRGYREDEGARRALCARRLRRGRGRRVDSRHHVHGEGCRGAAGPDPCASRVDPRFRVLDESQGRVLRGEAFEAALTAFCANDDPVRLRLLAVYGANGLRRMLTGVYETLRSAGRELVLELGERPSLSGRVEELREAARCLADDDGAGDLVRETARQAVALLDTDTRADRLFDLPDLRVRGERAASYEEARRRVEQAALDELAAADRDLLQELLSAFAAAYQEGKDRESALDFEDLQLRARDLLRDDEAIREREQLRFRSIMVDEFQDTNRLQCELIDQLSGRGDCERF